MCPFPKDCHRGRRGGAATNMKPVGGAMSLLELSIGVLLYMILYHIVVDCIASYYIIL